MTAVVSEYRLYIVFINLRIGIADRSGGKLLLGSNADLLLVTGANLRVRYDGRKKQSVSFSAFGTPDAADTQPGGSDRKLDGSMIVAMYGHTGRMSAGTG